MNDELLTTEEIAEELKFHIETVRKWIREKKLKATRINRKEYRVRRSDLDKFLEDRNSNGDTA
jgi:excisionase family DNA binding protein